MGATSKALTFSLLSIPKRTLILNRPISLPFFQTNKLIFHKPISTKAISTTTTTADNETENPIKHSILLERLRQRHLKESSLSMPLQLKKVGEKEKKEVKKGLESFSELGLCEEAVRVLDEMNIKVPTEIQCIGIPAVLDGTSVVLGSHTGSGKTLAYLLPIAQLLKRDEAVHGMLLKAKRPRAVVLCPTRELCEQVYRVAKQICHVVKFRPVMVSGGASLKPQEDTLNSRMDIVIGTPGRVLQHIKERNIVYGDIKYLVLDEADTMFDHGFGPDIRKFLEPLNNRASRADGQGFQTVLVTATMSKGVQTLVDEEFKGITHLRTSSLHKKIANARHDFMKLSGSENKLEALLQVLEPSLAKGNRVMVFCNTLNSSRAVDHFLTENQFSTVNYHGEVPADQRVENLEKFKSNDGDCPTLVCTDLAARGLDLDVDHVIMFDFPSNSIDYLHRTGRTARMGAKGKVTSLVARRDQLLAARIEEAISKNESLESLSVDSIKRDFARSRINEQKDRGAKTVRAASSRNRDKTTPVKSTPFRGRTPVTKKTSDAKPGKSPAFSRAKKTGFKVSSSRTPSKPSRTSSKPTGSKPSKSTPYGKKPSGNKKSSPDKSTTKLNVVGFRGRSTVKAT